MAWTLFNWGARGPHYDTGNGVYVATVLIPHCVQVNIKGSLGTGEELLHVFHCSTTDAEPSSGDTDAIAGIVNTWATANWGPELVRSSDTIDQIVATSRAVLNGPQSTIGVGVHGGRDGADGAIALPASVTVALKKSTGLAGRSNRGRFYAWPMWSSDLDPTFTNILNSAYALLVVEKYTDLLTNLASGGYPMGVASTVNATIRPVTSIVLVDTVVDNQRRRLPGRGA